MQYIQLQSQDPNSLNTPLVGSFNIFVDQTDNNLKVRNSDGEVYGGDNYKELTYSGLVNTITTSGLSVGSFYLITNFRTCYDQPDFNYVGNSITTGNYKQSAVQPIIVFATSVSTISSEAYQPTYPNDKIKYDWTYSVTETTNGVAYGRITERIDEFNNRTDYDHRTILFKRYRLYTHRQDQPLNGTVQLFNNGTVSGTSTSFNALNVGDVICIPNINPSFYEITGITNNFEMAVSGDTISSVGAGQAFYKAIEETNDIDGYFSHKRTNVKTNDFKQYTTFGNAISENYAKNNYIGNFSDSYVTQEFPFLLANNVFLEGQYESNKFGDYCYNNTWGTDNQNNTWGDWCYANVSTNDIDGCVIGNYFYGNLINLNLVDNQIGNNFNNNRLLTENSTDFANNKIGNYFNNNTLYSGFYDNSIGNNFQNNTIGDFGNLDNFEFYRNQIGNYFNENTIRRNFQNNQIGNQFNNNTLNGDFYKNIIDNGFNNNQNIGHDFYGNHIGNGVNVNEMIGDYFQDNQIGEYFYSNSISYNFKNNQIGNQFENNTLGDTDYFNWVNTSIENLTGRTYNTFNNSLDDNYSNVILGKELIMHFTSDSGTTITNGSLVIGDTYEITDYVGADDFSNVADVQSGNINETGCVFVATGETPTVWSGGTELTELTIYDEYHKVKFTQWWDGCCDGGFSYQRTKVYPSVEPTVYFTRTNSGSETDVIVAGRLEITRSSGIYNAAKEGSFDSNVSPIDTEWNSIYTQNNDGNGFEDNVIGNEFKGNLILNNFSGNNVKSYVGSNQFSGSVYTNEIGSYTFDNDFLGEISDNRWVDWFYQNNIGLNFYNNTFGSSVSYNNIADDFQNNQIGGSFNDNIIGDGFGVGYGDSQGNRIGNNFSENTVGEYFYNNSIPDNFYNNTIGDYFQWNVVNTNINTTDFTPNYGNITGFTYTATGTGATDSLYTDIGGTTNALGVNGTFNIDVSGGTVTGVTINNAGKLYVTGNTITILGTSIGGATPDDNVVITVTGVNPNPSVYGTYTCQLFERQGGVKRLSFYDNNDILTITNINE